MRVFLFFSVHGENCLGWPKWGREFFFPTNPDLADILGRTDLNFETFYVFHFLDPKFLDFQVPRYLKSGLGRAGLGPWVGPWQCCAGALEVQSRVIVSLISSRTMLEMIHWLVPVDKSLQRHDIPPPYWPPFR